jgi:hypothetical protein
MTARIDGGWAELSDPPYDGFAMHLSAWRQGPYETAVVAGRPTGTGHLPLNGLGGSTRLWEQHPRRCATPWNIIMSSCGMRSDFKHAPTLTPRNCVNLTEGSTDQKVGGSSPSERAESRRSGAPAG